MKLRKSIICILLVLCLLSLPAITSAEEVYTITGSELTQLEQNNKTLQSQHKTQSAELQTLKKQLSESKRQLEVSLQSLNKMSESLNKLEKEARIKKWGLGIGKGNNGYAGIVEYRINNTTGAWIFADSKSRAGGLMVYF